MKPGFIDSLVLFVVSAGQKINWMRQGAKWTVETLCINGEERRGRGELRVVDTSDQRNKVPKT